MKTLNVFMDRSQITELLLGKIQFLLFEYHSVNDHDLIHFYCTDNNRVYLTKEIQFVGHWDKTLSKLSSTIIPGLSYTGDINDHVDKLGLSDFDVAYLYEP